MGYYRDLRAWKAAHELALDVYRVTKVFPRDERFGLTAQLRRAAVSVVSNIAEGAGRRSDAWLLAFLGYAMGSLHEVEAQLQLAADLGFAAPDALASAFTGTARTGRLIAALSRALRMRVRRRADEHTRPRRQVNDQ